MNLKLWTIAGSLAAATVGCVVQPPPDLTGGSGGSDSSGNTAAVTTGGVGGSTSATTTTTGTGDPGSAAKQYYVNTVHPALASADTPSASCTKCHATGLSNAPAFMADDATASYSGIEAFSGLIAIPESSSLLLHDKHTGPALTATQYATVKQWLEMEAKERGLEQPTTTAASGQPPVMTLDQALKEFGACMDINDFLANGLNKLYQVKTVLAGQDQTCEACHNVGLAGNWLSANANETFDAQQSFPFIKRWVSGVYDMKGNFTDLKAVPRNYLKGVESANCKTGTEACHPRYLNINNGNFTPELKAGIDNFIAKTLDKWHNKQCPPP